MLSFEGIFTWSGKSLAFKNPRCGLTQEPHEGPLQALWCGMSIKVELRSKPRHRLLLRGSERMWNIQLNRFWCVAPFQPWPSFTSSSKYGFNSLMPLILHMLGTFYGTGMSFIRLIYWAQIMFSSTHQILPPFSPVKKLSEKIWHAEN